MEEYHEVVIINRRGHRDVALIDAAELRGLEETAHLLRSPANAARLLQTLQGSLCAGSDHSTLIPPLLDAVAFQRERQP